MLPRAAVAMLFLAVTGCARPDYGLESCLAPPLPSGEETVQSLRYRIRTDAGRPAAHETVRFMERAAALWTPLFGVPDPLALPLEVKLYRKPADLVRLLSSQRLATTATGLYLPTPHPAIHVACRGNEPGHPYRTLLHEGTHQFIQLGAGFREPGRPPATPPRLALPLWLSEGLATYYEAAFLTPDILQSGRPDPARLLELQEALRHGRVPSLASFTTKRYGEPFSSLDYAIAWGMVYALMQESPPPWASGGREWLQTVIARARQGWPASAPLPAAAGDAAWWQHITDQARTALDSYFAARGLTLAGWETHWRDWILAHP